MEVRQKAAALGAEGAAWLDGLGAVLDGLERDWGATVDSTLRGGSDSYVAGATTVDGAPAVIKVALPGGGSLHELETLLRARGRGYVRLLRHDGERDAMLLERLGVRLSELNLPVSAQIDIVCATLRRAWEVPPEPAFQTGAQKACALAEFIAATWEALDRQCSERVIERALACARSRERAFEPERAVLVHGDAHADNTLAVPGSGGEFRFVDPDGMFAEPAADLAVPMREWSGELLQGDPAERGRERCARLSRLTGADPAPIWEWDSWSGFRRDCSRCSWAGTRSAARC